MSVLDGDLGLVFPDGNSQQFAQVAKRQTVFSGPVDSGGLAAFGGSTGSNTVTAAGTIWFSAANGPSNRIAKMVNPQWSVPTSTGTYQLLADANANQTGTPVTGGLNLFANYQHGGTYSTTTDQLTFNIQELVMKVGVSGSANQVYRVAIGEVDVAGGVVTAIRWYGLNGRYVGPVTTNLPAASTQRSGNHNLGFVPKRGRMRIINRVANASFNPGEEPGALVDRDSNGYCGPMVPTLTRTAIFMQMSNGGNLFLYPATGGVAVSLTATSWDTQFECDRGDW